MRANFCRETISQTHPNQFWAFVEHVADGHLEDCGSDLALYGAALSYLKKRESESNSSQVSLFEYALSLKLVSPRLEAFYEYFDVDASREIMMGEWNGELKTCVLVNGMQKSGLDTATKRWKHLAVSTHPLDHVYPAICMGDLPVVVVYTDFQSLGQFKQLHLQIKEAADRCEVRYILRLSRPPENGEQAIYLAGYGVEMALKRTDYIVIDDRNAVNETQNTEAVVNQAVVPLTPDELEKIGIKAASYVMVSENPLDALRHVSQDFLHFMPNLTKVVYKNDLNLAFVRNSRRFPDGDSHMWINGLEMQDLDAFDLFDVLQREHKLMSELMSLGLSADQALDLLTSNKINQGASQDFPRFDVRQNQEDEAGAVIWLNDLEKDSRYRSWKSNVQQFLRPVYPGQLHSVKLNAYSVLFPLDFASKDDLSLLIDHISNFIQRNLPIRFGVVAFVHEEVAGSRAMASTFYHLIDSYGRSAALKYLEMVLQDYHGGSKLLSNAKKHYQSAISKFPLKDGIAKSFDELLSDDSTVLGSCRSWIQRLQVDEPSFFVNGHWAARDSEWIARMSRLVQTDLSNLQIAIDAEILPTDVDFDSYWFEHACKRRNKYIFSSSKRYINLAELSNDKDLQRGIIWSKSSQRPTSPISVMLVVVDIESGSGLLEAAVKFQMVHAEHLKLGLIFQPRNIFNSDPSILFQMHLENVTENFPISDTTEVINAIMSTSNERLLRLLDIAAGDSAIVLNGRRIGPITDNFGLEDFEILYQDALPATKQFQEVILGYFSDDVDPIVLSAIESVIESDLKMTQVVQRRSKGWEGLEMEHTSFIVGAMDTSTIQVVCLIDPVSELAQKWSSILCSLVDIDYVHLTVILNPVTHLSILPINRFYQYLSGGKLTFDLSGKLDAPTTTFRYITHDDLYTMGVEVPDPWVVMTNESLYDLDNIQLSRIGHVPYLDATYQLKHILINGHATDTSLRTAPRGVQLQLDDSRSRNDGTIIMANLGYFQLKANPGLWRLRIKDGKSNSIFKIDSLDINGDIMKIDVDGLISLYMTDFRGITGMLKLSRLPGKEQADVLGDVSASHGALENIRAAIDTVKKKFVPDSDSTTGSQSQHTVINIFSVASGHLYERFLYIMITSVLRHTKSPVKFWFIENYLSPSFKVFGFIVQQRFHTVGTHSPAVEGNGLQIRTRYLQMALLAERAE